MNGDPTTPQDRREELRRQWLAHAAAAFDLMFHPDHQPDHQPDLTTFDQREQRANELTDDLNTWLLQQHANADPAACQPADASIPCPRCGKPACLVQRPQRPLFRRGLTTLSGDLTLHRQKWHCATCRVAFFPSGPEAWPGG